MKFNIVADENMPLVEEIFADFGSVKRVAGRTMSAEQVAEADLLLVRSVTQVNEALLAQASPKFVGTATIGTDHIDTDYLQRRDIAFSSAPGCNADAVVEYVLSSVFHMAQTQGFDPADRTWGIIGVGNVGGRLQHRLEGLGYKVLLNDPPREAKGDTGFVPLEQLLAEADIICMHTPLTRTGEHPSHHLLSTAELSGLNHGAILLNAGRGPVIDNAALFKVKQQRDDITLILDVWEHEPVVDPELAALTEIATPHIAGYSHDGKIRGTFMLYEACCRALGLEPAQTLEDFLPAPAIGEVTVNDQVTALELIRLRYDPYRDDRDLRRTLQGTKEARAVDFDRLRKQYPQRREFSSLTVSGVTSAALGEQLKALGFKVS
ncbi:4-phosphoerythronate dehydrogenase PdxB [Pontibacterium granulatum]|uniref:4-phosphoerythronate dehydrogenase PdxB n=1 Tax=Pontibacterium granulatum TaxID=2036029 RepID=UPI00249BE894|nr:4-phosphoerythronate dehydrogenase PdxB [Pontibacterium granulatum]MDI3325489.1 4-phosphoerythronate dehydrogenase PdxB [Pontibacterium granulatum]